jgi:hypothetical protein
LPKAGYATGTYSIARRFLSRFVDNEIKRVLIRVISGICRSPISYIEKNNQTVDKNCASKLPPFVRVKTPYLSLKRLRLSQLQDFLFDDGQFDFLLSLFLNLIHLYLIVAQYRLHNEIIDFVQIGQCLRNRLRRLSSLEFRMRMDFTFVPDLQDC